MSILRLILIERESESVHIRERERERDVSIRQKSHECEVSESNLCLYEIDLRKLYRINLITMSSNLKFMGTNIVVRQFYKHTCRFWIEPGSQDAYLMLKHGASKQCNFPLAYKQICCAMCICTPRCIASRTMYMYILYNFDDKCPSTA